MAMRRRSGGKTGFMKWLLRKMGWPASSARQVTFKEETCVFEFERQLLGWADGRMVGRSHGLMVGWSDGRMV